MLPICRSYSHTVQHPGVLGGVCTCDPCPEEAAIFKHLILQDPSSFILWLKELLAKENKHRKLKGGIALVTSLFFPKA